MTRPINIRFKFLQGWKLARFLILFSTLLVFSPFSFSQNLLTNPGFENGTNGWTLAESASAQFTESNGRSGSRLTHWSSSSSYRAETKQTVSGLAVGTYRLSVYTVGGETSAAWLWAYCDGQSVSTPIPSSPWGSWAQVVVDNISVSGGSCELGITTENSEWTSIDDVVFEQVSGGGDPSEIVIEEGTGFCGVDGSVDSNHSGFNGIGFANTDNATGDGADWQVNVPSSGDYTLEWRYANGGSANRPGEVLINGSNQAMVDFPVTGSWESWTSASAEIVLSAGENSIRLQGTGSEGLGNIDSLSVTGNSPQAVACGNTNAQCGSGQANGRFMECLDRGVIAHQQGSNAFVSWRLFGYEPRDTTFNLYRQDGGNTSLVCSRSGSDPTWCLDSNESANSEYFVRPVVNGDEGEPSASASLLPRHWIEIPLAPAPSGADVRLGWVGDLTGNGEYEVIVDRKSSQSPKVDAYTLSGEFLWRLDTGPLGVNQNNIEGGPTTISNGHNDGLTVFDFDSNGKAEVAIKTANGFVFGDGQTLNHNNNNDQFVSIVNGETGAEITRAPLPDDYISDGPLQCHFGAGYLDGQNPSVVTKCKNRVGSGGFNLVVTTYDFDGTQLTRRWKYNRDWGASHDFHQIRIMDVDGDGMDEVLDGGYALDQDGTVLYDLRGNGVVHGDRFHITDIDPTRPGLEGFAIQQDNPNGLETYYYDAATGEILRAYYNPTGGTGRDLGRGTVADVFPEIPGMEYWSFNGLYAANGDVLIPEAGDLRNVPWPNFEFQWDGDLSSELLDQNRVGDWDTQAQERNTYVWRESFNGIVQARGALPFFGDILGDWREEVIIEASDHSHLKVYTTGHQTDHRIYTLPHNPGYRNSMTVQGYKQSHHVDYYLGEGMSVPPMPLIRPAPRP
ncbi:carbohydrate-binding protein [Microbulbifer rhizosphaerae]|uniref:CBM6 domain-containing protein n=1 Tax=Microbulbifer rhizosphaerae TaxID=1562603 RepID=A0A7W4WEE8_9GAMM|nr:carbohydrate-binding protein [Microbulbifer rhizosphaerae]MBB3062733.1 hypothetical protein [Microbulbifer rhizosphaerae]